MSPESLENVKAKWIPEILHHSPKDILVLLVGTKADLRDDLLVLDKLDDRNQKPTTAAQGERLAKELGLVGYKECSAATQMGVKEVFDFAIKSVVSPPEGNQGRNGGTNNAATNMRNSQARKVKKAKKCTIL